MREVAGQRFRLKYHPFPFKKKGKKEYVIGEALLRWKGMYEHEVATLRNVPFDPPDLVFETKDFGEIRIEITESVPYDRGSAAKSVYFVKRLRAHLKELGTSPPKPSNIFVSRESFDFPSGIQRKIESIAGQIDLFFKNKDFEAKYEIIQEIVTSPIRITFVPALGAFAVPLEHYDDNIIIHDIIGYPLDRKQFERSFEAIVEKKSRSETAADVLIVFHGTIGIVGRGKELLDQVKDRLALDLAHEGIYIVEIIQFPFDYWVDVITVREHTLFAKRAVQRQQQ